MKKLLIILLMLSVSTCANAKSYIDNQLKQINKNVKSNSVRIHERNYVSVGNPVQKPQAKINDPKLIKLSTFSVISDEEYKKKLAKDEKTYQKEIIPVLQKKTNAVNIEPSAIDFYNLYRISERLIRANNLDYANWLISVRKTADVNAYASNINHITIHTGLYDSLYGDDDALAFVIAHEMAHLILGHQEQDTGMIKYMDKFGKLHGVGSKLIYKGLELKYNQNSRNREYMADAEGLILLTKAGYSPQKAISALNTMDTYGEVKFLRGIYNTHPDTSKRIESFRENMSVINPEWVEEGKSNIYNSEVLGVKKSSDRVSFVIDKSPNVSKFYQVEDVEQRLRRLAYASYLNGNFSNSIKVNFSR
jgi:hypothetical protein